MRLKAIIPKDKNPSTEIREVANIYDVMSIVYEVGGGGSSRHFLTLAKIIDTKLSNLEI